MKVKISINSHLFGLISEAIAYKLTKNVDYKPYNQFESLNYIYHCGKNCDEDNCEIHGDNFLEEKEFEWFEVLHKTEIDGIQLVQITNYGTLLWTTEFDYDDNEYSNNCLISHTNYNGYKNALFMADCNDPRIDKTLNIVVPAINCKFDPKNKILKAGEHTYKVFSDWSVKLINDSQSTN